MFGQTQTVDTNGYTTFYYPNGKISSIGKIVNGKPDGYWKSYYPNGNLKSEGYRRYFLLDSTWIFYNEQGDTTDIVNYYLGKKNGYSTHYQYKKDENDSLHRFIVSKELFLNDKKNGRSFYYKNNRLWKTVMFVDGIKNGPTFYYTNDTLVTTIELYKNNFLIGTENINRYDKAHLKHGTWKYFYDDGTIRQEEHYIHGKLNGDLKQFSTSGKIIEKKHYEQGVPKKWEPLNDSIMSEKKKYSPTGQLKYSGFFKHDSIPIGVHREYASDGSLSNVTIYDTNGIKKAVGIYDSLSRRTGEWTFYFPSGQISSKGHFRKNKRIGKWVFFYPNGDTEQVGTFKNNRINGIWKWYYHNEKLRRLEHYDMNVRNGLYFELSPQGDTITVGNYTDGEKNGIWKNFTGDQIEYGRYVDNMQEGLWQAFNKKNNKLIFKGFYNQGELDGKVYYFYNNGKIKRVEAYRNNIPHGLWIYYDDHHTPFLVIKYRHGKIKKINGQRFRWPKPLPDTTLN